MSGTYNAGAVSVPQLSQKKARGEKVVMLTAYDFPTARHVDASGADMALVGDSLGMEELGFDTTLPVTMDIMLHHARAVRRGVSRALLVVDMPFGSYQTSDDDAVRNAVRLVQEGGANAVKLEGGAEIAPAVRRIVNAGIPVVGHLGFTPQSVNALGVRKQGKDEAGAQRIRDGAQVLADAGAFAAVLELIPAPLAAEITRAVPFLTIGIGAGPDCDGQVLVTSDLLGLKGGDVTLRHVKQYARIGDDIARALSAFGSDVRASRFP